MAHLQPFGVLIEHGIDDVNKRLVAREKAVPASQQIALEPALALVLAEHFHDPAVCGQMVVIRLGPGDTGAIGDLEHRRIGRTTPSEAGFRNLLECQLVASAPVSASPSPTTQATIRSGLSKAAP
jgi:hypothetical protein